MLRFWFVVSVLVCAVVATLVVLRFGMSGPSWALGIVVLVVGTAVLDSTLERLPSPPSPWRQNPPRQASMAEGPPAKQGPRMPVGPDGLAAPSQQEVERTLRDLLAGRITRETAAAWAKGFLGLDEGRFDSPTTLETVQNLAEADRRATDHTYIHDPIDFQIWLGRLPQSDL